MYSFITHSDSCEGVNNLIKLAINHWRITGKRVVKASDILRYTKQNEKVKKQLPVCPNW